MSEIGNDAAGEKASEYREKEEAGNRRARTEALAEKRETEKARKAKKASFLLGHRKQFKSDLDSECRRQRVELTAILDHYQERAAGSRRLTNLIGALASLPLGSGIVVMPLFAMHSRDRLWIPLGLILFGCCVLLGARGIKWLPSVSALQNAVDALECQRERLSAFGSTLRLDLALNFWLICKEDPDKAEELLNLKRRFLESSSERTFSILIPGVELPPRPGTEVVDPEEPDPEETDPEETDPEETDPEETDPEETDPEETDPEETDPAEASSTM